MFEPKNKSVDKDSFRTPQYIVDWLDSKYSFEVDLAASDDHHLFEDYYTQDDSAFNCFWTDQNTTGFCNPNYSNIDPWIDKAIDEASSRFTSVFLIPDFNGEERFDKISKHATTIIHLIGRVSFIAPCDFLVKGKNGKQDKLIKEGDEMTGNNRGSCVVEFSYKPWDIPPNHLYFNIKDIKAEFGK